MSQSINQSLPPAFLQRMQRVLGDQLPDFLAALAQPAPVSIRLNAGKITALPELERVPWAHTAYYLPQRPAFAADPWWHAGAYYAQEASSMFLEKVFRTATTGLESPLVLDLAAAPGGKSTLLALLLPPVGLLVANEVIRTRAHILAENVTKWGSGNVIVTNNDPVHFQALTELFDVILLDAPCSGEGLFRKDPAAVNEWSEANVQLCSERQQRILADVWDALKPGGILIYSTCTYEPSENEAQLQWLRQEYGAEGITIPLDPAWGVTELQSGVLTGYQFYPHRAKGEGLFMAALRKPGTATLVHYRKTRHKLLTPAAPRETELVKDWVQNTESWQWIRLGDKIQLLPSGTLETAELIAQRLRIVYMGVEVAELIRTQANPLPALALFKDVFRECFPDFGADPEMALRFLRKEDIVPLDSPNGWVLITSQELPLGWVKKINNRANNYWPKEWRLRMEWKEALQAYQHYHPL